MGSISVTLLFRIKLCSSFLTVVLKLLAELMAYQWRCLLIIPLGCDEPAWSFPNDFSFALMQRRLQNLLDFDVSSVKYANTHLSELSPPAPLFLNKTVRTTIQISQEMGTHSDGSCSSIKLVLDKNKLQPLGQIPQESDYFILHFRLDLLNSFSTVSSPPHKIVPFTACRDWQPRWAENKQVSYFCNPHYLCPI